MMKVLYSAIEVRLILLFISEQEVQKSSKTIFFYLRTNTKTCFYFILLNVIFFVFAF